MATRLLFASLLLSCLAVTCYGAVHLSTLKQTLDVTASSKQGQVLKGGEDNITVTWGLNRSLPMATGTDRGYSEVKVMLCYSPISQKERAWRKTEDNLSKDKTCQFTILKRRYEASVRTESYKGTIERDVPTATYFVRVYVFNSAGEEVAFGQSTNAQKTTNLFDIQAISGRHASLDIASVCFSAFSVVSLFGFFFLEKRKARKSS